MKNEPETSRLQWRGCEVRGVIFDFDGVIVDTGRAHADAWREFARREGLKIDADRFLRETFGRGNREVMGRLFPERAGDAAFIERKGEEKEEIFLEIFRSGGATALPGLHAFLDRLDDRGAILSIGSSAPRKNIEVATEILGIADRFSVVVSSGDVTHAKPAPDIFLLCAERMSLPPEACLVLEDSIHGIEAGREAGCLVGGVTTLHPAADLAPLCDFTAADFHEIAQMLFDSRI